MISESTTCINLELVTTMIKQLIWDKILDTYKDWNSTMNALKKSTTMNLKSVYSFYSIRFR